jgi:uncharacterized coiled-coil protein SlyX
MSIKTEVGQVPMASAIMYADRSPIEEEAIKIARELRDAKASIKDFRHIVEDRNKVEKELRGRVVELENRLADQIRYTDTLNKVIQERDIAINKFADEADKQAKRLADLERLRPHWAQGWTGDSVAAQVQTSALTQLWKLLGVDTQSEAVGKLTRLKAEKPAEDFRWVAQKVHKVAEGNAVHLLTDPRFSLGVVFSYDEVQRLLRQLAK